MRYEANYYGVGHGLFCCGALYTGNSKTTSLNYIYDCGTSDSQGTLKRHIDEVVDKLPNRPLDLLFLSHMHKDHVSGLPYLLDQLKKKIKKNKCVQKIILPYFYPAERVVLFAEALENQFNNDIDDRYQSFLIAPESFLLDHGAEEVVFVRGGDDPKSLLSGFPQQEPSNGDADFNNLDERPLDVAIDPKFESTLTEQCRSHEKQLGGDSLSGSIITSRSVINTRYWFFVLYNKDVDDNKLQQFLKQFESLRDEKSIEQVLTDSQKRREIKNAYKKLVGDINNSSLAVLFTCNVQKFCLPRHCFMDFIGESQPGRCFCFNWTKRHSRLISPLDFFC